MPHRPLGLATTPRTTNEKIIINNIHKEKISTIYKCLKEIFFISIDKRNNYSGNKSIDLDIECC